MRCKITPMPGTHCVHNMQGRCLYEERRNPGLHEEWQCLVLMEWEKAYDQFLSQAEAFQLEIGLATRIWARRLGGMLLQPTPCDRYQPRQEAGVGGDGDDVLACVHSWIGLCLLCMPACEGVCRRFELPTSREREAGGSPEAP